MGAVKTRTTSILQTNRKNIKFMGPKHWHEKKIKGMAKESFYGIDPTCKRLWSTN